MPLALKHSSMIRAAFLPAVATALLLCSEPAGAQHRGRIVFTPAVELLVPGSYYAQESQGDRTRSEVDIRQDPVALVGGQLSYELPGTSWRVGVGYARGESDLEIYRYFREGGNPGPGGGPTSSTTFEGRYAEPATRELMTLAAARELVRGPASLEMNTALVHQRLDAVVYSGALSPQRVEGRYNAWGLQLGGSAGPARGWARGLRVGARAQLMRTPSELYDAFRFNMEAEADPELEVGLVASLGWRLAF